METYCYLYKITNLINNKIYIGVHKTNNLDDEYMGSGKLIMLAIKKYGIGKFEKEIINYYESEEDMFNAESIIVNEDFVKQKDTYNLVHGGHGGAGPGKIGGLKSSPIRAALWKNDPEYRNNLSRKRSENAKRLQKEGILNRVDWTGKRHKPESKAKIGKANSKHQSGSGNSQYGKMWIYNEDLKESKRISKDDQIPNGWKQGRKMKF